MKPIILSRVSSEEQKKGFSPEAQLNRGREYVSSKLHLTVFKEYVIEESSTRGKRQKFWEIIKEIEAQKEKCALIVETVDRLQRGFRESAKLEDLILDDKLEIHFVNEYLVVNSDNLDEQSPIWDLNILKAKWYINDLRKGVKRGLREARNQGVVFIMPPGYKRKNGEVTLTEEFPYIQELYSRLTTGEKPVAIARDFNRRGARLLIKRGKRKGEGRDWKHRDVTEIARNPFYYGIAYSSYGNYPHIYEKAVDKDIWDQAQETLDGRRVNRQKSLVKPFIFRNILKCESCGWTITPDGPKPGRHGRGEYIYYKCGNKHCKNFGVMVNEDKLLKEVEQIIEGLVFPQEAVKFIVEKIKADLQRDNMYHKKLVIDLEIQYKKDNQRLDNLADMRLDREITADEYAHQKSRLEAEQYDIAREMSKLTGIKASQHERAEKLFMYTKNLPKIWKVSNIEEKNKLLRMLLLEPRQNGREYALKLKDPFARIYKKQKSPLWCTRRDSNP